MKKFFLIALLTVGVFLTAQAAVSAASYEETVAQWTSYKDVAKWLDKYFSYDYVRAKTTGSHFNPRPPEQTFQLKSGVCHDGAAFAKDALNRINPAYNAKFVFVKNAYGWPHHWVTAFTVEGKLFIMDYAAGSQFQAMMGTHGPYESLKGYADFLSSLNIPGFKLELVEYRKNR